MSDWQTFGDFADDAALGIFLFVVIPIAIVTWWVNRKGDDK